MNTNPLSTVGLMLTLAGLVGSFFNIQLSAWLRDMLALDQKAFLNSAGANESQQKAIVECKIELKKLDNKSTYIINFLVIAFVIFVLGDGLLMIGTASQDPLYGNINVALWVFLIFFVAASGWMVWSGRATANKVKETLNPPASE